MKIEWVHDFPLDHNDMITIQKQLAAKIQITSLQKSLKTICGVDVAYQRDQAVAVLSLHDLQSHELIDSVSAVTQINFDYLPGFLAFRELPPFLEAWRQLTIDPDLVMFDAHGYIHPRRCGLASHASFFIEKPTIGVAKRPYVGNHRPLGAERGSMKYVVDGSETLGVALRTLEGSNPIYVSVGNNIELSEAVNLALKLTPLNSRMPAPLQIANRLSKQLVKEIQ
ncbi:MAG: endonuclease V [Candidatus Kariarchaeaceae archaeon]|jgi:deoxyribonuclease V